MAGYIQLSSNLEAGTGYTVYKMTLSDKSNAITNVVDFQDVEIAIKEQVLTKMEREKGMLVKKEDLQLGAIKTFLFENTILFVAEYFFDGESR